jgi:undecaprenyl-diphosphatase
MSKDILSGDIQADSTTLLPLTIGFIAAFLTGLIACKWMIRLVKNSQLKYFAYYCFIVGGISIVATLI